MFESMNLLPLNCRPRLMLMSAFIAIGFFVGPASAQKNAKPENPDVVKTSASETVLPQPSSSAQRLYSAAKNDLLQIRVLVKNGRTQSSVGSGFFVEDSDLVVTNYHVVSQIALEPETYVGEFVDTNDQRGTVDLLAVDVLHDLAVVKVSRKGKGFFKIPNNVNQLSPLAQGQYLYSLGNPLDLGFAISEGAYNGVIARAFYDQFLFTGPINAGMSGGPNVNGVGAIAGVNVAKRTDGELVSFLVPARFVVELVNRVKAQKQIPTSFSEDVGRQLLAHQNFMVDKLLENNLSLRVLGKYQVPVRESEQMRCWGSSSTKDENSFSEDKMNCAMESSLFVSGKLQTGHITITHTLLQSKKLDALRFSRLVSERFKNQIFASTRHPSVTAPACNEDFVKNEGLSMRAVLCVRAYRKFPELYDFIVISSSLDQASEVLQSHLDTRGVSYENGMRMAKLFLKSIALINLNSNSADKKGVAK